MKIGFPTMGNSGFEEEVSGHFGRAPTFTLVDPETKKFQVVQNTSRHAGGSGQAPEILQDNGVDLMVCSNLGPRAIKMFESFGIEVYIGAAGTVKESLEKWKAGGLNEATDKDACDQHRHGKPSENGD